MKFLMKKFNKKNINISEYFYIFGIINNSVTEQLKKFVLAQKKHKVETIETYYKKIKKNEKRNKTKSNLHR